MGLGTRWRGVGGCGVLSLQGVNFKLAIPLSKSHFRSRYWNEHPQFQHNWSGSIREAL